MSYYTTNYCQNPSFQQGLSGYSAIDGTLLSLDPTYYLYGFQSALVQTKGGMNDGITIGGAVIPQGSTCTISFYLSGSGNVSVQAYAESTVIGSTQVTLIENEWQRVQISGPVGTGQVLSATVTSPNTVTFWVSGVQVEQESPAHPYCDGDQPGCYWLTAGQDYGISYQEFATAVFARGFVLASGGLVTGLTEGEIFNVAATGKASSFAPLVVTGAPGPIGAMSDFAIYESTDPDPAMTYVSWNNTGVLTGATPAYSQPWATWFAPLDYVVSNGQYLWKRAAFGATGYQFASVPAGDVEEITDVYVGLFPLATGYTVPTLPTYTLPREINTIVIPNRLNFVTNPNFQTSVANWTAIGSATLAQSTTIDDNVSLDYDDETYESTRSMRVSVHASGDAAAITVNDLIVGNTYAVSAYLLSGPGMANITMYCGGGSGSVLGSSLSNTGYGIYGGYGDVPYGDVIAGGSDLVTPQNANFLITSSSTGWTGFNGTFSITGSPPAGCPYSYAGEYVNNGTTAGAMEESSGAFTVTGNTEYLVLGWCYSSTGTVQLGMDWQYPAGTYLSTSTTSFSVSVNTWTFIATTVTSPEEAVAGYTRLGSTALGETIYGSGIYVLPALWFRPYFTFTAAASSETLLISSDTGSDVVLPTEFWVDSVLVEVGEALGTYFDGNYGPDYFWESTQNLSRSYYYEQFPVRQQAVLNTLEAHVPLGISFSTPQYDTPYTQN